MSLIGILVALVVICLLFWAVNAILHAFGVGDPIATVVSSPRGPRTVIARHCTPE